MTDQGTDGATNNTDNSAADAQPTFQESLGEHGSNEAFKDFTEVGNLADAYLKTSSEMAELRDSVPVVPESYEFDMEGLDETAIDSFKEVAKDLGLSQDQAAKVLDFNKQRRDTLVEQAQKQETDAEQGLKDEWKADYDKNLNLAKRAIETFTDDKFKAFLEETRLGSNPQMVKLFHTLGTKISEDTFAGSGTRQVSDSRKMDSSGKAMLSFPSMET